MPLHLVHCHVFCTAQDALSMALHGAPRAISGVETMVSAVSGPHGVIGASSVRFFNNILSCSSLSVLQFTSIVLETLPQLLGRLQTIAGLCLGVCDEQLCGPPIFG